MKNSSQKISANEINRFIYCPYQWYYTRDYGAKVLHERYKALGLDNSPYESNFIKGQKFHSRYYRGYRLRRAAWGVCIALLILLAVWWVVRWR